jgi:predicted O-methyltransferase YrrM
MAFDKLVYLARTVKVLKPTTIFEMGTYNGLTTAVFILNSEQTARIFTLDLPSDTSETAALSSDGSG